MNLHRHDLCREECSILSSFGNRPFKPITSIRSSFLAFGRILPLESVRPWKVFALGKCSPLESVRPWKVFALGKCSPFMGVSSAHESHITRKKSQDARVVL